MSKFMSSTFFARGNIQESIQHSNEKDSHGLKEVLYKQGLIQVLWDAETCNLVSTQKTKTPPNWQYEKPYIWFYIHTYVYVHIHKTYLHI